MSTYVVIHGGTVTTSNQADARFAIGAPDGPRSSIWRLWATDKGDVYITVRSLGGKLKASLHTTGSYHFGLTFEYAEQQGVPVDSRHLHEWSRPAELGPGLTVPLRIIVPASELRSWPLETTKAVQWQPPPAADSAGIYELVLARQKLKLPIADWPGRSDAATHPVAVIQLTTGETLWLLYRLHPLTGEDKAAVEEWRSQALNRAGPKVAGYTRMVLWGWRHETEVRFFLELAV